MDLILKLFLVQAEILKEKLISITLSVFQQLLKTDAVKEYDATKFDESAKGLITSARFGRPSIRGIKDGDWTEYDNIDISTLDSINSV